MYVGMTAGRNELGLLIEKSLPGAGDFHLFFEAQVANARGAPAGVGFSDYVPSDCVVTVVSLELPDVFGEYSFILVSLEPEGFCVVIISCLERSAG